MSFRLFGIPVEVQIWFWITSLLLGGYAWASPEVPRGPAIVLWTIVVFVSILVHELGHAFAMMRHGIAPEITLTWWGGATYNRSNVPLRRRDEVVISLAGPFAGFLVFGLTFAATRFFPQFFAGLSPLGHFVLSCVRFVNLFWGVVNLVPVLPLDGGQALEHTLGPRYVQLTAAISTLAAFLMAAFFLYLQLPFAALMFGYFAFQSYRRFAAEGSDEAQESGASSRRWTFRPRPEARPDDPESVPPELDALLRSAEHALGEEDLERARSLAEQVLEKAGEPQRAARRKALEVLAWTHLLAGQPEAAAEVLAEVRRAVPRGAPDAAVEGAVLFALRDFAGARKVLEAARAKGDDRKQVVGPLVQVLLEQGEAARAAHVALSVVDTLSDEDARRMGGIAFEHGAFPEAAALHEAIFERAKQPDDAYEAARAEARGGRPDRALALLRRAVEAGFSDRARAWSDAALATLASGPDAATLESVLPKP